jgi:hypothetical protein
MERLDSHTADQIRRAIADAAGTVDEASRRLERRAYSRAESALLAALTKAAEALFAAESLVEDVADEAGQREADESDEREHHEAMRQLF